MASVPLVVDLDGTLVRTDTLHEQALALAKEHLPQAFLLPAWLLRGKAHLKQQLARRVSLDAGTLPWPWRWGRASWPGWRCTSC
ncbi:hypothetical protein [Acidovorax sp. SDU_ACID1]|uniref:hypothetical protein n=1 Tax=Acidovorax sp. SDU_ACID1 TaxID=3136632 RepID=UPI003873093E